MHRAFVKSYSTSGRPGATEPPESIWFTSWRCCSKRDPAISRGCAGKSMDMHRVGLHTMTLKAATLDYRVARYLWYFQPACTSLAISQGFEERASQFLGPLGCSGKTQKIMCKTQNSYVCVSTQDPLQTNSSSGLGLDRRAKSCNDRPWKPIVNCDVFCLEHARSRSVHFLDCSRSLWQAHKARVDGFSTRSLEGGAYWSLLDAIPLIQTQSRDRDCVSASKLWRPVD